MTEDQQVYKNLGLVQEKLYMSFFIGIFGVLGGTYVFLFIEQESPVFWIMIVFINLIIAVVSYYVSLSLKKVNGNNLDLILCSQFIMFVLNVYILYGFISNSIFNPENYPQLLLNNEVMIITFISLFFISNWPKMISLLVTEIDLMYYTIYYTEFYDFKYLLWIHIYLFVFFFWLVIQQTVMISVYNERSERMELNSVTMHDLRNYVYSLNDIHMADSRLDWNSNPLNSNPIINESKEVKPLISESKKQSNYVEIERDNHLKVIWNKICFLYHIELIYDHNYLIKDMSIDSKALIEELVSFMKPIFMYKHYNISLKLLASQKDIKIDKTIFEYLIINITKMILDHFKDNLNIKIYYNNINKYSHLKLLFSISYLSNTTFYKFKDYIVNSKLIEYLKLGTYYYITYNNDNLIYDIYIPNFDEDSIDYFLKIQRVVFRYIFESINGYQSNQLTEQIVLNDQTEKYVYDTLFEINSSTSKSKSIDYNLFFNDGVEDKLSRIDIENVEYKQESGLNSIYINVDDEFSILKMNKRVCSKLKIPLNLCLNRKEFFNLLGKIHYDIGEGIIDKDKRIIIFMDHFLDGDLGYKVIDTTLNFNQLWGLDLYFILLSSTEGMDTLVLYQQRNITDLITKPLTKPKLNKIINDNKI